MVGLTIYFQVTWINNLINDNTSGFSSLFYLMIVFYLLGIFLIMAGGLITFYTIIITIAPKISLEMTKRASPAYEQVGESLAKGMKKANKKKRSW